MQRSSSERSVYESARPPGRAGGRPRPRAWRLAFLRCCRQRRHAAVRRIDDQRRAPRLVDAAARVRQVLGVNEIGRSGAVGRLVMSTGMPRPLSVTRDGVVRVDDDLDRVGLAGQGLVDGVVHDLVDEVVEPALARGADVHAGALAHGLEALEDGDVLCGVADRFRSSSRASLQGVSANFVTYMRKPRPAFLSGASTSGLGCPVLLPE